MDKEKNNSSEDGPPLGSLESRALARLALESNDGPPSITVAFVNPDKSPCDSRRATVGDETFIRGQDETLAAFEKRVSDSLPVIGPPTLTVMLPVDGADNPAGTASFIARGTINDRLEAFQSRSGESEKTFLARLRERFGADVKFSTLSWPSNQPCPYKGPLEQVQETATRLGLSQ